MGTTPRSLRALDWLNFFLADIQTELVRSWLSIWRPIIGIRNRSALFLPVEDFAGVIA
jgi:hypothetical protein